MNKWSPAKINGKWEMTKVTGHGVATRPIKWYERIIWTLKLRRWLYE
jgi:hypothetical protein